MGYEVALGDVYSDDAAINNAEFHASHITGSTCDGSILTLHTPDTAQRAQTLEVLQRALPKLVEREFDILTLTDMFRKEAGIGNPCGFMILGRILLVFAVCIPCCTC